MTGLILLLLALLAGTVWWQFLKGREMARRVAGLACRDHGLLLMDDTVILDGVKRDRRAGLPRFGLRYRFDYALQGRLHRGSSVLITPQGRATVVIDTESGQVIEEF
ncbi:DUF3301 domain-containing protein [Elongatibacter sediminis]|uniref:DUF3301 domain-containing protein n=1 Tax=Elongatibacter sediminis TaxID=3119006 RepID=A0AAW9RCK7_9GAMM